MEVKESYDTKGYAVLKNFIDVTAMQCELPKPPEKGKIILYQKGFPFDKKFDKTVPGCSGYRMHPRLSSFVPIIQEKISSLIGIRLYKTYHLERFYYNKMGIGLHTDNGGCEVSLSLCLNKDENSKSHFLVQDGDKIIGLETNIGDAVLYKGCEVSHGRSNLSGDKDSFIHQAFFHFVNPDGLYLHWAYDSMYNGGIHQ